MGYTDVEYSKGFLSKKCLTKVLSKDLENSMMRRSLPMERNIDILSKDNRFNECMNNKLSLFWNKYYSDIEDLTSKYISAIMKVNQHDADLYSYALENI